MWTEVLLAAAAIGSPLAAFAAVYYKRRQPELDQATAAHQLISSDAVKAEIERSSRELNAARDLRVLDLEKWADKMRPVIWKIKARDDVMGELIKGAYAQLTLPAPMIPEFPEIPEFPAPRPL
jgi:hypothetical protein